ncbi:50S ribosomal protein L25/general stress protein Ctc [Deinococcus deserti]|uniref:Large ribosomal subunit protein bL25 n=1 Tax=Deinococcus deserti (strain DSM 17065 / CIP 109153 / LMG 22923 / VCD115) TaxID=546414 RepID=RL25_DEIDV|nr:50S ribosomal protein L25/general stress protein Ctc [Deinococcus deserti]C1CZB5.1 RecName: Full=Large ribosomal subunit protein bL25; AltName: Full=50S ribosomal protein L25; AltName: Full=General stress protein CTC [Deinococcus deserti VCD115]ACO45153.1 putative 50S ribosomal protein L25 (General stress protein CTC) [Deinococcus deserti VCD115]
MELNAKPRKSQEKLAEGLIPAVAYNKDNNISFALDRKAFDRAFRQQSTTGLFDITVEGGETFPALVKTVQMDKRRRTPIHVDFYMVTYGEPIEVSVPVHTTGKSQGEIMGGLVDIVLHNLSIVAPGPRRIPQELTVDVSRLNIGDHITAGDVKLPEGCTLAVAADSVVISVLPPRMTADEAAAETQAAQVAGLVAAGELSEEAAAAVLEGDASIEEIKAEAHAAEGTQAEGSTEEGQQQ